MTVIGCECVEEVIEEVEPVEVEVDGGGGGEGDGIRRGRMRKLLLVVFLPSVR